MLLALQGAFRILFLFPGCDWVLEVVCPEGYVCGMAQGRPDFLVWPCMPRTQNGP